MSTSALASPVSGFTWSFASVSGSDPFAMSIALAAAGFEGAGLASAVLAVVPTMRAPIRSDSVHAGLPAGVALEVAWAKAGAGFATRQNG